MLAKFINTIVLVMLLSLPLYGARTHMLRNRPAAKSDAEHRADLAKLTVLPKDEFLVTGHGAPRSEYAECNRELPQFYRILAAKGLNPIETVTCVPVDGENDTYVPSFRAIASEELEISQELGGRYNSLSFCELEAQRMGVDLAKKNIVLETSCKHARKSDFSHAVEELYQPTVILLSKSANPGSLKQYNSIEVLVDSSTSTAQKALNSNQ